MLAFILTRYGSTVPVPVKTESRISVACCWRIEARMPDPFR